jgi:chromosome segregation ATPase
LTNHSVTNDLIAKINDLRFLEDELDALKLEMGQAQSTIRDLDKDNNRLRDQLEKTLDERDKLRAFAVNLTTRLSVISENVSGVIREAGRSAVAEAGRLKEQRQEQQRIAAEPPPQPVRQAARRAPVQFEELPPEPEHQEPTDYAPSALIDRLRTNVRPPINEYR